MADEFKFTYQLTYENGQQKFQYQPNQFKLPQTTQGVQVDTVTATTADADLSLGVTTPGRVILQSLEATTTGNFVTVSTKTSTGGSLKTGRLNPKDFFSLYMNSTSTLRVQADTANVNIQVIAFEV